MKKKILIADDEEDIRDTIKTILLEQGYDIITAKDSLELIKKIKQSKPDLILLDIMMPGPPIKEVIPKIKTKICFLSVLETSNKEKKELINSNKHIIDFIEKPFEINELVKKIKSIFKC
jgi:DNA-binding response OmpR family regulator